MPLGNRADCLLAQDWPLYTPAFGKSAMDGRTKRGEAWEIQ